MRSGVNPELREGVAHRGSVRANQSLSAYGLRLRVASRLATDLGAQNAGLAEQLLAIRDEKATATQLRELAGPGQP